MIYDHYFKLLLSFLSPRNCDLFRELRPPFGNSFGHLPLHQLFNGLLTQCASSDQWLMIEKSTSSISRNPRVALSGSPFSDFDTTSFSFNFSDPRSITFMAVWTLNTLCQPLSSRSMCLALRTPGHLPARTPKLFETYRNFSKPTKTCRSIHTGQPAPLLSWYRNGEPLEPPLAAHAQPSGNQSLGSSLESSVGALPETYLDSAASHSSASSSYTSNQLASEESLSNAQQGLANVQIRQRQLGGGVVESELTILSLNREYLLNRFDCRSSLQNEGQIIRKDYQTVSVTLDLNCKYIFIWKNLLIFLDLFRSYKRTITRKIRLVGLISDTSSLELLRFFAHFFSFISFTSKAREVCSISRTPSSDRSIRLALIKPEQENLMFWYRHKPKRI